MTKDPDNLVRISCHCSTSSCTIEYNNYRNKNFRSVRGLSVTQPLKKVLYKEILIDSNDWFKKYKEMTVASSHHVLLESGRGGRLSIMGVKPRTVLSGKGNKLEVIDIENGETRSVTGDLLSLIKDFMSSFQQESIPELPDFQGGIIGYISYDVARQFENLPTQAIDDLALPDVYFLAFEDVLVFDQHLNILYIITYYDETSNMDYQKAKDRLSWYEEYYQADVVEVTPSTTVSLYQGEPTVSMSEEQFMHAVEKVQHYIKEGDVFQVNLSVRQSEPIRTEPISIYDKLREINPSPYMGYFHTPTFQLVSGSPELLVKKKGNELSTRPIAGTRSRGRNEQEDFELARTLVENEKERAEHVMLVDLERNDLGRVCEYGSVEVNEFMVIEKYSHVQHIVSNVRGLIRPEYDGYDAIRATFPGGTITGAPKIRTMEIIEELEPVKRGIYTGSIGWIGYNGDMELNIAIRTMVVKDGQAYVQAGAGIVIDSSPHAEYKESLKKAKALWKAKELSEEERF
jgi:para-aminobenzoate synthetase component 1